MDFPIVLDDNSADPLFIQLSKALKERILEGTLPVGAPIPPTRELANALGVSRGTVVKAYEDLIAQGYLESVTGSSTFVSKRGQFERKTVTERERHSLSPMPTNDRFLSKDAKKLMEMSLSEGISGDHAELNYGSPPQDMLPLTQWKELLMQQCRQQQPHHFDSAPETLGHYQLRCELASHLARWKGLNCQPEQIVVFPGSQQALNYVAKILINPGDTVVVENPGYGGARDAFRYRGAELLPIDIDNDGLKVYELESVSKRIKLAYVTPSYHDPTGTMMAFDRRNALVQWASKNDALIIEDGWDSDFTYAPPPLPSLQGLDKEDRVIHLYSFWKILYPLTTVGCAVVPPSLVPVFDRIKFLTERQFPVLEHSALAEFLRTGALALHIKRLKPQYEKRRKALTGALFSAFKTDIEVSRQSAGLHLCIRVSPSLVSRGFVEACQKADLSLVSTKPYYAVNPTPNEFLIPFAALSPEEIEARVASLAL